MAGTGTDEDRRPRWGQTNSWQWEYPSVIWGKEGEKEADKTCQFSSQ